MPVYLDHAATTPMLPEVLAAYTQALGLVGNPSSIHSAGQNSKRMLEEARERVADALGADPVEIVFTSGGTESVNLGIKGLFWARNAPAGRVASAPPPPAGRAAAAESGRVSRPKPRILVPHGEHHATLDTVEWLERHEGAIVEWIRVDEFGRVDTAAVAGALAAHDDVALLTFLWANNEVGTIQPVVELVALAEAHGVPVHVDAVAAMGHLPIDFGGSRIAALSVSAHKIGGPLGIGALALSRTATLEPLIHGGGQQRQVRSGTQDAPAAIGFGVAAQQPILDLTALRDRLIEGVRDAVPSAVLRGHPVDRLSINAHFTFPGCEGDSLLFLLDAAGVAVSTGSACQAGVPEASHVLLGMGLSEEDARGALRFTLGHSSTDADVAALLAALPAAVERATRAGYADRTTTL